MIVPTLLKHTNCGIRTSFNFLIEFVFQTTLIVGIFHFSMIYLISSYNQKDYMKDIAKQYTVHYNFNIVKPRQRWGKTPT